MSESDTITLNPAELTKIWDKRAQILAQPPLPEPTGDELQIVTFTLNNMVYGVEAYYVQGAYPLQQLTPIPRTPPFMVGLFNRRGHLTPVIDLYAFWGMTPLPVTNSSHVVVVNQQQNGFDVGLLADSVTDMIPIYRADLEPPLTTQAEVMSHAMLGIWKTAVILDLSIILTDQRLLINQDLT